MILYHGSKKKIEKLERRQAKSPYAEVPAGELLDAIYFTPNLGDAISMAARPQGLTEIKGGTITFEHPEDFDPEREIYIYQIDSEKISERLLKKIDENQYAYLGEELSPESIEIMKAIEVTKHFKLLNWEPKKKTTEPNFGFKIR